MPLSNKNCNLFLSFCNKILSDSLEYYYIYTIEALAKLTVKNIYTIYIVHETPTYTILYYIEFLIN